jgi:hypothetical protein
MRHIMTVALAIILCPIPVLAEMSDAKKSALQGQLADLASEIAAARSDAASYKAGSVLSTLATVRAETHALTAAMLKARLAAEDTGTPIEFSMPVAMPDPEAAARIETEVVTQQAIISKAEEEASRAGGLIQMMAISRVQAEKLTLARLRSALMQARYGAMIPAEIASSTTSATLSPPRSEEEGAAESSITKAPSWADPSFPEIDYNAAIFQQLDRKGFAISGWWGLLETRAEVDDSPRVLGLHVEKTALSSRLSRSAPGLQIGCNEGTLAFIYDTDDYLLTDVRRDGIDVTYRIEVEPSVTRRWSKTTSGKAVGLFGREAIPFLKEIYDAKRIFLRVVERNGKQHDTTFDLSGTRSVIDAAAAACGTSLLDLSRDDYRAIQEMLNAAGFDAGTPDGNWGAGSKRALKEFQTDRGLSPTGAPDTSTLKAMGLSF